MSPLEAVRAADVSYVDGIGFLKNTLKCLDYWNAAAIHQYQGRLGDLGTVRQKATDPWSQELIAPSWGNLP